MTKYWTLKTEEVWNEFKKLGYIEGSEEYALYPEEYKWMMQQMALRLPEYNGEYPVWLWLKKPDMRSTSHFESGTKCVRLTVELDEKDVLISDFENWHMVLNDSFNADSEDEYEAFYRGELSITKEESWERIFDLNRNINSNWSGTGEWLQGVTGRITLDKINKVEHFVARKRVEF
ncbi:protein of unknown function [Paenibacillus sophorae]|uniref:DUF3841 domain-containing protein n=1 Tax=Paenibacillus sophorae TaxID=1333845 RepID=A0A1H8GU08_9BACL|nr:DUF3841 domain-containing protein [Paenibacillus sophorae]QWU14346.1 DUF3841 domain-containing protein [Paenibacillus sophorae]SEN47611.1 protein of unknown function [Paenibacillus sophorae]